MLYRCYDKKNVGYERYGGRGITICERWRADFWNFLEDIGDRPAGRTLDRIDNDGPYAPENCRWATISQQNRNFRTKRIVEIEGKSYHVADLQDQYGVDMRTIYWRAKHGYPFDKVVSKEKFYNTSSMGLAIYASAQKKRDQTHCKRGHPLSGENLYIPPGSSSRHCRTCKRMREQNSQSVTNIL